LRAPVPLEASLGTFTFGRVEDERDLPALARMLHLAFTMAPDGAQTWMRVGGLENLRVLRDGKTPLATLMRIPMGQFYGGRSVPMVGIGAVAVAPEARGRGIARRIMQDAVREIHAEGWPISVLYPSTQTLYRQIGYEQAGHRFLTRIPLASIDVRERGAEIVALEASHQSLIEDCYTAFAATQDGWVERSRFGWTGIRERRGERYPGFGVMSGGRIDGYVFFTQRVKPDTNRHDLIASDLAFRTAQAGRRLLGFLADFATIGDDVVLAGGPQHPLVWLLGQQRFTVTFKNYWMLRITDVRRALEARAYPSAVRGEVSLAVEDDLIDANQGRFTVSFDAGRAGVREGGAGDVRVDVRALAALWSGFWTPSQLGAVGAILGPDDALATLHAAFAGGTPAMNDMF
jgi:predicted acetyltransferase